MSKILALVRKLVCCSVRGTRRVWRRRRWSLVGVVLRVDVEEVVVRETAVELEPGGGGGCGGGGEGGKRWWW